MRENIDDFLNTTLEKTLHLPIKVECRSTSARGRLSQAIRLILRKSVLLRDRTLLDIASTYSEVLSDLIQSSKNRIMSQQVLTPAEIRHSILSANEEEYEVLDHPQTLQPVLLRLRLSLNNDELKIRVFAPRHLWLSVMLREKYPSSYFYSFLYSDNFVQR